MKNTTHRTNKISHTIFNMKSSLNDIVMNRMTQQDLNFFLQLQKKSFSRRVTFFQHFLNFTRMCERTIFQKLKNKRYTKKKNSVIYYVIARNQTKTLLLKKRKSEQFKNFTTGIAPLLSLRYIKLKKKSFYVKATHGCKQSIALSSCIEESNGILED